jgi:capsule polysaccharide export protein KpsE/RkpR
LNLRQLDSAESALGDFEKKNGIYILQEQARAELGTIAAMEQQKSMAEIELKNVLEMYGSNAAEASSLRNSINGIEQKLDQMRTGQDARASSFVPTNILPEAALQFLRLTREVEIQSKLKAFFLPLYEQARLDENRNLLSFVVMDHAIPAERKSRPRRSILILVALIGSFVTTAIMIFVSARTRDYKRAVLFPNTTRNT